MKLFKKKNWAFYLFMFCVSAVVFLLVEWLFDKNTLGHAMIGGLISGGIMTSLWWFFDQAHERIQDSVKEDEADRKSEKKRRCCPTKEKNMPSCNKTDDVTLCGHNY